jgi:L-ascorbate metabolism protein UlaG (beta-lactamase superfamily)
VDISWLGHACIRIRAQQTYVIMDPCDKESGYDMGRPVADLVTISNPDPHHSNIKGVRGEPLAVDGPGEYEVKGVQVTGVATFLNPPEDETPTARNTVFVVEAEEVHLAHLGGLGAPLTAEQTRELTGVDILIVPLSGSEGFGVNEAARTVRALEPSVVIPVLYPTSGAGADKDGPLQQFISGVGVEPESAEARVTLLRRGLPETLQMMLLEPRGS